MDFGFILTNSLFPVYWFVLYTGIVSSGLVTNPLLVFIDGEHKKRCWSEEGTTCYQW